MKQFYVVCGVFLLLHAGAKAQTNELYASRAEIVQTNPGRSAESAEDRAAFRVTGSVTDENGEPFLGVTIAVKGTSVGTITDATGKYSLEVPDEDAILV